MIHVNGEPRIVRTIPRGGAEITDAIANKLKLPPADAERLKREVGLLPNPNPQVGDVIREALRPLVSELRSSFEYLAAGDAQLRVESLALCGGSAMLPGLVDALGQRIRHRRLPRRSADPVARIAPPRLPRRTVPVPIICRGLRRPGPCDGIMTTTVATPELKVDRDPLRILTITANLLPVEITDARREHKLRWIVAAVLVVVVARARLLGLLGPAADLERSSRR